MAIELVLKWLPCQGPGVMGSALGLVGVVSLRCDCVNEPASSRDRLVGLVVKASAPRAADPGLDAGLFRDFSGSSHGSDLKKKKKKKSTSVATLPGAWRYRVSTGIGWPCVSILRLGEVGSLICSVCLGVAARTLV